TQDGARRLSAHVRCPKAHIRPDAGARSAGGEYRSSVEELLTWVAPRVPGIHAVAIETVVVARHSARDPVRELSELRLGDDDRARVFEILRERRFVRRDQIGEDR